MAITAASKLTEAPLPKLTDTQLVILSAAAARDDDVILPLPDGLKANKATVTRAINSLIKRNLIAEKRVKARDLRWREENGRKIGLFITPAGLEAINADTGTADRLAPGPVEVPHRPTKTEAHREPQKQTKKVDGASSSQKPRPGTKRELLIGLLSGSKGSTIPELQVATGWLPHTVRAAMSGLRKQGYVIDRRKHDDGFNRYRIIRQTNPGSSGKDAT